MKFNKEINLFELTNKVVEKFRLESGMKLTGYEFEFKFNRDWNCPKNRININLLIFGVDYTHTRYDDKYDTIDKVIDLLFVHLRDDAGIDNLKDCLIDAKRHSMELRTQKLSEKIKKLSKQFYESKGNEGLMISIDEKYPYSFFYENNFPIMQYQIYSKDESIKLKFDLDFNLRGFNENEILEFVNEEIKKAPNKA